MYFPAAVDGNTPQSTDARSHLEGNSRLVLVVDDEEAVLSTARNTLHRRGYPTIEVKDGREAVEVFGQFAHEIALVLLDLTMPFMNGEEVFRELRWIAPSVRVVLSSGFNEAEAVRRFTGMGWRDFYKESTGEEIY